jgi:polysaccharide export outer membrane protein
MDKHLKVIIFFLLFIFSTASSLMPPADAAEVATATEHSLAALGPGDTISVQVYGQPDMNSTVYVGDNGAVSLPLVGAVKVAGLSPVEAATHIEQALKEGQYLVDPHVTVAVVLSRSQRVSVIGEVKTPGRYPLDPGSSVLDVLALAGGPTDLAAETGFVVRQDPQGSEVRLPFATRTTVDANGTGLSQPSLRAGDSINVPRAEHYYVYGEVAAPNMYKLETGMTVIQAITRAGGITLRGSEHRIEITRTAADGSRKVLHAKPNDPVQANDVVRVKESLF